MAQTQNSEAPANQWPAQDGDAIRLSNRLALQQQRFVKKSQVNTGLPSNNPATRQTKRARAQVAKPKRTQNAQDAVRPGQEGEHWIGAAPGSSDDDFAFD